MALGFAASASTVQTPAAVWIVAADAAGAEPAPGGLDLADAPWFAAPRPSSRPTSDAPWPSIACFRREVALEGTRRVSAVQAVATGDERFVLWVNGTECIRSNDWRIPHWFERRIEPQAPGIALTAVVRKEDGEPAPPSFALALRLVYEDGSVIEVQREGDDEGGGWRFAPSQEPGWRLPGFSDAHWEPAAALARKRANAEPRRLLAAPRPPDRPNQWYAFRREFELSSADFESAGGSVRAQIAVDSRYWLWVNGELVVREGGLKRGPNPEDTYVDEVELRPFLKRGRNSLAILTCYFGKHGFSHKSSGRPGLYFSASIGPRRIQSDRTWRGIPHPAFSGTRGPHPNQRLSESNVRFDGRLEPKGWRDVDFDDSDWPRAKPVGAPPIAPWNRLVPRPIPQWRHGALTRYENARDLAGDGPRELAAELPQNLMVYPALSVRAEPGKLIGLRPREYGEGASRTLRAEYVTRGGEQLFECPIAFNGSAIEYSIPSGVEVEDLFYRPTGYATDFVGQFQSDDELLDGLWAKAATTLALNMRDSIQDPDRERAQWWGDAVIALGQILAVCDSNSHALIEKAIRNLVDWQKGSGVLYAPVPAGSWEGELPLQMLAALSRFGIYRYYEYTGDAETLAHAWPAVRRYLELFELNEDGLVSHRPGDWAWGDWGTGVDYTLLENLWFALALEGAGRIAAVCADARAGEYTARAGQLARRIDEAFWTPQGYRSKDAAQPDERANALAVLAGTAQRGRWPVLVELFARGTEASPYMEAYVLEALFAMDEAEGALERMRRRYRPMVESELSTLWETWEPAAPLDGLNHAWAGGPLTLLAREVGGVRVLAPGASRFEVAPAPADLRRFHLRTPLLAGMVDVRYRSIRGTRSEVLEVDVPPDASAQLALPPSEVAPTLERIADSMDEEWDRVLGAARDSAFRDDAGRWRFTVPAGRWRLELSDD